MVKEYRTLYVEEYLLFVDDVRIAYLDADNVGPGVVDMVDF